MNNRDWERFGEDIRRTIQDAVEYGNYDRLNQTITNTVNQATDWVSRNMKNVGNPNARPPHMGGSHMGGPHMGNPYMGSFAENRRTTYHQSSYQYAASSATPYAKKKSKVGAIVQIVFGGWLSAWTFVWTLLVLITALINGEIAAGSVLTVFNLMFLGASIFLLTKGILNLGRVGRFNIYKREIGAAEFCNISDLAARVNKSIPFVVKDLERMIQKQWFTQGHLDKQKTCLIVTDQMYRQYQQLEKQRDLHQKEEAEKSRMQEEANKKLSPEVQKVIAQGDAYVKKIRECNDAIPGEEISEKIYHIEMVVDKIFDRVEQNPDSISDIQKLMDYYLPTTVKLLEAYAQMDAQPVGGENIQTAKREIEATLDTLNIAFEKLLDSLFQDAAWDVSSDISVLNTMLAQEGLKDDGLKK